MIKNALNYYFTNPTSGNLVKLFMAVVNFAWDNNMLPKVSIPKMYELSYDLDNTDLRLAYMEFKSFPSEKSIENILLVILMLCKGFGLTYGDFKKNLEKIMLDID